MELYRRLDNGTYEPLNKNDFRLLMQALIFARGWGAKAGHDTKCMSVECTCDYKLLEEALDDADDALDRITQ